jgi:hypothetical protein
MTVRERVDKLNDRQILQLCELLLQTEFIRDARYARKAARGVVGAASSASSVKQTSAMLFDSPS